MNRLSSYLVAACLAVTPAGAAAAQPVVHTTDFIQNANRSQFNGFESFPYGSSFYESNGPYVEDTISVEQIHGRRQIWLTYRWPGNNDYYNWYPNGGDNGYTQLSLTGGVDFQDVGFNYGSGGKASLILYELLDDGSVVLSGTQPLSKTIGNY